MPNGIFSDEEFDKIVSSLDTSLSAQSRAYLVFHCKNKTSIDSAIFEFKTRMIKWRLTTRLYKQAPLVDPLILDVQRTAMILFSANFPQRVLNAILLTWLNAWITHDRFQQYSVCRMCLVDYTEDKLSHFAVCKVQQSLGEWFFHLPHDHSARKFICLENEDPILVRKRAIHLYIFKKSYDFIRHKYATFKIEALMYSYRAQLVQFFGLYPKLKPYSIRLSVNDDLLVDLLF